MIKCKEIRGVYKSSPTRRYPGDIQDTFVKIPEDLNVTSYTISK